MPILTLVVPQLKSNGLSWRLTGRSTARQCLVERGLLPVLAAPSPSGRLPYSSHAKIRHAAAAAPPRVSRRVHAMRM